MSVDWHSYQFGLLVLAAVISGMLSYLLARKGGRSRIRMRQSDLGAVQASHITDVPRLGGFAILVSFLGVVLVTGLSGQEFVLIWSGLIVFLVGAWEDLFGNVSARRRLVASMIAAAVALFLSETAITRLDIEALDLIFGALPPAAMLLTILLSAAYTHAFNLIDGMNGLSSTVGISTAIALASAANVHGQETIGMTSLLLAAAIFGFSVINWPKGKIFLGDGGAYFIGHILMWIAVMLSAAAPTINVAAIILIIFWPTAELTVTISRRMIFRAPLGKPDRLHIHQIVRRGIEIVTNGRKIRPLANALTTLCILPAVIVPPLLGARLTDNRDAALVALAVCFAAYGVSYVLLLRCLSQYKARRAASNLILSRFRQTLRRLRIEMR